MEFTDGDGSLNLARSNTAGGAGRDRVTSLSPTGKRRHRDPAAAAQGDSWRTRKPVRENDPSKGPGLADFAEQVNRLSPEEESRARASTLSPVGFLSSSSTAASNPSASKDKIEPVLEPSVSVLQKYLTATEEIKLYNNPNTTKRPDTVAIRRCRLTLVGAGEAGKTSLRKCFASNPLFFKNLPEVGTTTGIDTQRHRVKVSGDSVIEIDVNDFAGQEVYHSHSLFLTNRTLFLFVWNMSNVEQTFDDYGISEEEEVRLKQWADVVQAKCPGAPIIIIGTHKDQLRDPTRKTVVLILNKVCKLVSDYVETLKPSKEVRNISIGGSFCVSCRDRSVIPENLGGPTKIKELFQWISELCHKHSKTGTLFSNGCVPRYVVSLIATLEAMRQDMETVLLPMKAYNTLCKQLGVPKELLHKITTMLHDWGVLYLFDKSAMKLGRQDCVFLHPLWLSEMVSSVFTYAHTSTAPAHERATMEVGDLDIDACDACEPSKLILEGVLTVSLAKVLFSKVLLKLKREPSAQNIEMCFTMLRHLDLIYKNTWTVEEGPYPVTHSVPPMGDQYYVPSIFPRACPQNLSLHISRLARNTGTHYCYNLVPLPKEFIHMLHTRVGHMLMRLQVNAPCVTRDPPTKKVGNNWRDAWWMAGGGGEGSELGIGSLRALASADMDGRLLHIWAMGGNKDDPRMMTHSKLCEHFNEATSELAMKYPGIVLTEVKTLEPANATLEDDTFVVLTSCMRPPEVSFLMESLGFEQTDSQQQKLADITAATSEGSEPTSPLGQMKTSLLLDKLVKACMLQDSSVSST